MAFVITSYSIHYTKLYEAFLEKPSLKVLDKDPAFVIAESIFREATILGEFVNRTSADLMKGRRLFVA